MKVFPAGAPPLVNPPVKVGEQFIHGQLDLAILLLQAHELRRCEDVDARVFVEEREGGKVGRGKTLCLLRRVSRV